MARPIDPLNDTDPQSPRARAADAAGDPGPAPSAPVHVAGSAQSAILTPTPASAAVDELLEGVTGPRPPPSARRKTPTPPPSERAYSAARPPPASQPPPPIEPRVISPSPPTTLPPIEPGMKAPVDPARIAPADPGSVRPLVRRAEEKTVYTGRRAFVRNGSAVLLSAACVAGILFAAIRWTEHRPAPSAAASQPLAAPAPPAVIATPAAIDTSPAVAPVVPMSTAPPAGVSSTMTRLPSHRAGVPKHAHAPTVLPSASSPAVPVAAPASAAPALDDLNQTIRH